MLWFFYLCAGIHTHLTQVHPNFQFTSTQKQIQCKLNLEEPKLDLIQGEPGLVCAM